MPPLQQHLQTTPWLSELPDLIPSDRFVLLLLCFD
uniref:Predicted protein n=1 Tax=Hordeum vulgare subsp. vulgare TaxID=112509 RepID=F2EAA9_HORVV|nr:predicted protein [Hordeum vulgare subsp. vulgare]